MRNIICIAFMAVLMSCATQPISPDKAIQVTAERIFKKELVQKSDQKSEVVFLRDKGFLGSAAHMQLFLNKELFAEVDNGEILSIWLSPGIYTFGALPRPNLFDSSTVHEYEVEVRPARKHSFRLGFGEDGIIFHPTSY